MVRALRSYSTSGGSVRSHPKERALKEGHEIRLRSGSAGHRPTKLRTEEEDEDGGEPIQVLLNYYTGSSMTNCHKEFF